MNTELRAWSKKNNWYINFGKPFTIKEACSGIISESFINDLEFEQAAGPKDKNKVKFFEGDIAVHESSDYYVKGVIEYDQDDACFVVSSKRGKFHLGIIPDQFEIIGNVHENKNLIEGEDES